MGKREGGSKIEGEISNLGSELIHGNNGKKALMEEIKWR